MRRGCKSTRKTVFTAKPVTSRTPPRTSTGWSPRAAEGRLIRTCSLMAAGLALLGLTAPAMAEQAGRGSLLDTYLHARADDDAGRLEAAAEGYATALAARPDDIELGIQTMRQAVEAGDRTLAVRTARTIDPHRLPA